MFLPKIIPVCFATSAFEIRRLFPFEYASAVMCVGKYPFTVFLARADFRWLSATVAKRLRMGTIFGNFIFAALDPIPPLLFIPVEPPIYWLARHMPRIP